MEKRYIERNLCPRTLELHSVRTKFFPKKNAYIILIRDAITMLNLS